MVRRKKKIEISGIGFLIIIGLLFYWVVTSPQSFVLVIILGILSVVCYFGFKIKRKFDKRRKALQAGIRSIDVMSGEEFETFLNYLFQANGYKVEKTKASNDYGADLILRNGKDVIAVQAKRYSKTVGVDAIQQVHAAKTYYNANKAWAVTNQTFSDNARELASKNGVVLFGRESLINYTAETRARIEKKNKQKQKETKRGEAVSK